MSKEFTYYEKFHLHEFVQHKDDHYTKNEVDAHIAVVANNLKDVKVDYLTRDGNYDMTGNLAMGYNRIEQCAEGVNADDCVTKKQLDFKLDAATFNIAHALPGVPVLDNLSIALIPELKLMVVDSSDRVSSWFDPVNKVSYTQTNDSKKPLLKRDSVKKVFYVHFDGVDDSLKNVSFDVSKVGGSNGNTCTVIIVVKTHQLVSQSQFQWGKGATRFGVHIPWGDGTIYIDYGSVQTGRLTASGQQNLTGAIEVWTIRVDGTNIELFRGTSITPIASGSISATLTGAAQAILLGGQIHTNNLEQNFCNMDLYSFAVWSKALSDDELKNMFRFFENHFHL